VRHLDRLFSKHLGASPLQVARTNRVQYATLAGQHRFANIGNYARRISSIRRFNTVL
jgi:AraC family transcriptional regulator of adaptative response / DNA-3-methyladenine glycosylase II